MKIKAPNPDDAARRGQFPEPSPAACGKRKLAEIAAARMLASVAASGSGTSSSVKPLSIMSIKVDGDATPPPPPMDIGSTTKDFSGSKTGKAFGILVSSASRPVVKGISLQIVNPESLGIAHTGDKRKRKRGPNGEVSPTTPWDGQLEALVSESKSKCSSNNEIEGRKAFETCEIGLPGAFPHPVCGPGSLFGRSLLHKAVCQMDEVVVRNRLSAVLDSEASVCYCDEGGYYPIHSSASLRMLNSPRVIATVITRLLLTGGADAACTDSKGNTPLHWAARAGDEDVANLLLMKNCPPGMYASSALYFPFLIVFCLVVLIHSFLTALF